MSPPTAGPGPGPGSDLGAADPGLADRVARSSALLAGSTGLVAVTSYACVLLLAGLLAPADFVDYAAVQSLLTVVGLVAGAMVPLPMSRAVRAHRPGSTQRRHAVAFAIAVSLVFGCVAGLVVGVLSAGFATPAVAVTAGAAALSVCLVMPVWGRLQGEAQFGRYAGLRVGEAVTRLGLSTAAGLAGWGLAGAVAGFLAGSALVFVGGAAALRREIGGGRGFPVRVLLDRGRWAETGSIALVVCVLTGLTGLDVLLVALLAPDAAGAAAYQALATLAKGPIYVATGTVLVVFPLVRSAGGDRSAALAAGLRSFVRMGLPAAAVLATVPAALLDLVLPSAYAESTHLLPWLALAGLGDGLVVVLAMLLLAARRTGRVAAGLAGALVVIPAASLLGLLRGGPDGLAAGSAIGAAGTAALLIVLFAPLAPRGAAGSAARVVIATTPAAALLLLARPVPWVWLVLASMVAAFAVGVPQRLLTVPVSTPLPGGGLRILHLGFEDAAMPGSGGGSLRTHEIDRRLVAAGHRVTVLTTRYPGAVDAERDGVAYRHIGFGRGRTRLTRTLGYLVTLPAVTRRTPADLVVEDFFAPISTMAAPLWSGRPTVGVVQWLNARAKARQYRIPVHWVERFGVRRHRDFVAMSAGVARDLTAINPAARIEVIGNGVDPSAFDVTPRLGANVVFVGRLEVNQKGLDLLLDAWARAGRSIRGDLVIAGSGPDEARLRDRADRLGIADRVRFVGWVNGRRKFELLAGARLVAVPSRFETFGIAAVEAQAAGSAVLAFDIPCLREVVPAGSGRLVDPYDVEAYAKEMVRMWHDRQWLEGARDRGRAFARRFDWSQLARRQAQLFTEIVRPPTGPAGAADALRVQLGSLGGRRTHRRRPCRAMVIGNVGNGNTGDEALLTVTLAGLDPEAEPTVLSRDPDAVEGLHGVPAIRMTPVGALRSLMRSDAVVVVGGGMFGPGLPPLVRHLPRFVGAARLLRRDVAYVGIGVYPGTPPGTLRGLRRAARRHELTVRDRASLATLDLGPDSPPCVGDLAWLLPCEEPTAARAALAATGVDIGRPLLLLSPKAADDAGQVDTLLELLSAAVVDWTDRGGSVAAIALSDRVDLGKQGGTDAELAAAVAERSGIPVPVVGPNLRPALAKAIVGESTAVVGLRFHAIVFALSTGRPCLGPGWEPKTAAVLADEGAPVLTDRAGLSAWLVDAYHAGRPAGAAAESP